MGKSKILVADDEQDIRDILRLLLEGEGYEVITARDGQEVLEQADDTVDLYLLDVNMPVMTGFAAAAKLRKKYMAPIIFLTAYGGESDKVMGFSVGDQQLQYFKFRVREYNHFVTFSHRLAVQVQKQVFIHDLILF